jgi:NAD(P)-dependent dehydrogenase (short-subunit alcohol dehydrogenase family)
MDDMVLEGKVAIVTGGAAGLGRAHADYLASMGASIVVNDVGPCAQQAAREITTSYGVQASWHDGDVGSMEAGQAIVDIALESFGRLDIVVNNAGIVRDKMIFSMEEPAWDDVVRVHGKGTFAVCRAASAYFRDRHKSGVISPASIINTASEAGIFGNTGQANYTFAKGGIVALSLSIHQEMNKYGVRCNVLCPRARTSMLENLDLPEAGRDELDPLDARQVSPLVAFLASERSIPISGQVFVAYGGRIQHVRPPSWGEALIVRGRKLEFSDVEAFARDLFLTEPPVAPRPRHAISVQSWSEGTFQ